MGHKSITVALVLGLISLPLACGGDDDDVGTSGGKGGKASGGKGGSAGKTAGGKGGSGGVKPTGGKGGGAGTGVGGTNAGSGGTGTGGTGNAGTGTGGTTGGAGGTTGGSGGTMAGQGGAGENQGGAGAGGDNGDPGAAHRQQLCEQLCATEFEQTGAAGAGGAPGVASCGNDAACVAEYCDVEGFDAECVQTVTDFLECMTAAEVGYGYYCRDDGFIGVDFAGALYCGTTVYAFNDCRGG